MPGKQRYIRSIDLPLVGSFDAGSDVNGTAAIAPPVAPTIGAPTNLALTTANERNAATPTSNIGATWSPPPGTAPSSYVVQWSTNSAFPDPGTNGQGATAEATTISGLIPATVYYVRVAAIVANLVSAWSTVASITTAADTVAPAPVTSLAAAFVGGGDLVVTWANPTSANFRDVEIKIYSDGAHTLTYATLYDATQRLVWPVAANLAATSGAGDPFVQVEARARSWGGIFSTNSATNALKAAPATPVISVAGFSQLAVCRVTSKPESPTSMFEYVWKRDGTTVQTATIADTSDTYTSGAAGDEGTHSWTCLVRERDAFGQYSSAATTGAVVLDTLTTAYLRAGLVFSDDVGYSLASLRVLKDGITGAGGLSYSS